MRLPQAVIDQINAYASNARVSKTDAILHYIQLGMESERATSSADRLNAIERQLADITLMLQQRPVRDGEDALTQAAHAVQRAAPVFPAIERAYVFGSVARGTAGEGSDIDLRLEIDRSCGFNLHDLDHFCKQVEQETGRTVDVVTAAEVKNAHLANAIEREKVLVYERQTN